MRASDLLYFGVILSFFSIALARTHEDAGLSPFREMFLAVPLMVIGLNIACSRISYRDLIILSLALCAAFVTFVINIENVAAGGMKAFFLSIVLLVLSGFRARFDASRWGATLTVSLLLFVGYNLYFYIGLKQFGPYWTWFILSGAYENQNSLAITLFCGILFLRLREHLGSTMSRRLVWVELILATLIVLTQSRATLLAMAVFYVVRYGLFNRWVLASACLISVIVGALLFTAGSGGAGEIAARFFDRFEGDVTSHRTVFWGMAFSEITASVKNLFFGVGVNSFTIAVDSPGGSVEVSVHNAFINALLNYGVIGLAGLLIMVANGIIRARPTQKRILVAAVTSIFVYAMFESNLFAGLTMTSFILALYLFTSGGGARTRAMEARQHDNPFHHRSSPQ